MSAELEHESQLEIAHVLFMDIAGYSKLRIDAQSEVLRKLNELVRSTEQFRAAEAADKLVRLPTGDGMALAFFTSPDAPVRCALEIGKALKNNADLPLRMGIHSGPVNAISDVNDRSNVAGAGINIAQRVMDCGDAGHILLSRRVADDLAQYSRWEAHLYDLGELEVKHGVKVSVVNFYTEEAGNAELPEKLKRVRREHAEIESRAVIARRRKQILSAALALFVAAAIAALWIYFRATSSTVPPASAKSMAVLPFKPLLPENRNPVLEMGMADTLITKLSNSGDMIVPSLTSVRQYGGLDQDPLAAGRKLGVNSILEGNVQKSGDRLRVTVRLIKVADGSSLWTGTFDEKFTDVFSVQDKISQKVAEALALRLSAENQKRLTKRYTDNVEAYQLYITGRYHWSNLSPPELQKSIELYKKAIAADPGYALAYYGLAESLRVCGINSDIPPNEVMPLATAAASKAIELDSTLAEPHVTLSFVHQFYDWNWTEARKEATRAIALNPTFAWSHMAYAHFLSDVGRHGEAVAAGARARELEPASLIINTLEGARLYYARRNDEAEARLRKVLELNANFWPAHRYLGHVAIAKVNYPEAVAQFTKAKELVPGVTQPLSMLAYVAARSGDEQKARAILQELNLLSTQRYVPGLNIAVVHLGLGETDEALRWLEKAYEEHDAQLQFLKVDATWDALRSEPRFVALLKRLGLPTEH